MGTLLKSVKGWRKVTLRHVASLINKNIGRASVVKGVMKK